MAVRCFAARLGLSTRGGRHLFFRERRKPPQPRVRLGRLLSWCCWSAADVVEAAGAGPVGVAVGLSRGDESREDGDRGDGDESELTHIIHLPYAVAGEGLRLTCPEAC